MRVIHCQYSFVPMSIGRRTSVVILPMDWGCARRCWVVSAGKYRMPRMSKSSACNTAVKWKINTPKSAYWIIRTLRLEVNNDFMSYFLRSTTAERAGMYSCNQPFPSASKMGSSLVKWVMVSSVRPYPPKSGLSVLSTTEYAPFFTMKP